MGKRPGGAIPKYPVEDWACSLDTKIDLLGKLERMQRNINMKHLGNEYNKLPSSLNINKYIL